MSDQDENERQCLVCWLETWQCNTADFNEEDLPDVSGADPLTATPLGQTTYRTAAKVS